jgi:hypothetical protein
MQNQREKVKVRGKGGGPRSARNTVVPAQARIQVLTGPPLARATGRSVARPKLPGGRRYPNLRWDSAWVSVAAR